MTSKETLEAVIIKKTKKNKKEPKEKTKGPKVNKTGADGKRKSPKKKKAEPKEGKTATNENKKGPKKTKKAKVRVFQRKVKGNSEKAAIEALISKYEEIDEENINTFTDLPLSDKTLKGLKDCGYINPTEIQKKTIRLGLTGQDILGAAQTGSGKTLAFLIPILEALYRKQWIRMDGLGALVITPTRELAYQIFETLRKVGIHHDMSAGLIIGGKDLKFERKRMDQCNIVIGTPGRLLQHMDENPLFECVNMQILVLDEADRCLDMGFRDTLDAIIANLPESRQTMLFSATQTKCVRDLARLSLVDPKYISAHEHSKHATPEGLKQVYSVCELHEKMSVIYTFIKTHLKQKIIIFLASCKQVKYAHEAFCRLRPGMSLLALYGSLHQLRRMDIYEQFCRKQNAVLFATDLAARGLDFPEVNWVVQADCPEDSATYIHRVGRTARYQRGGQSLLLLLPSEEKSMLKQLEDAKIPIMKVPVNMNGLQNPVRKLDAFLARDINLKDTAQRAFVSYTKAVFLMKDKSVFNIRELDTDKFAHSLGLAVPPRIRFLQRALKNEQLRKAQTVQTENSVSESEDEDDKKTPVFEKNKSHTKFDTSDDDEDEKDDNVLTIKRKNHDIENYLESELLETSRSSKKKPLTKAAVVKKMIKKKIVPNKKITFDDEGETIYDSKSKQSEMARDYENENEGGIDITRAKLILKEEDKFDKQRFREKVKLRHREEKRKLKESKKNKNEQQERDDFGEMSDGDEPDLSWLPDPDKIYGENVEENSKSQKANKRKFQEPDVEIPKKKKKKVNIKVDNLSVNETEELALMLLKGKT